MPSFHWPRTSIHENMWNSKSCPEGLPHRKNGAMASRQTPANTNAREIGFLSKWPLAYLKPLISCRDAACRVSTGGRALRRRDEQFYCIRKFSEKLTGAKSFRRGCRDNLRSTLEQTTGDWADTKDGASPWFPCLLDRFLLDRGRDSANAYWLTSMD